MNSGRPVRFRPAGVVWRVLTFCRALGSALRGLVSAYLSTWRFEDGYQPRASSGLRHPPQGGSGLLPLPDPDHFRLPPYDPELANPLNKDGARSVLPPHNPKYRMEVPG